VKAFQIKDIMRYIFCVSFLITLSANAQNFKPGSVELKTKEKVTGYIALYNPKATPRKIIFKKDLNATEQVFTPLLINSFNIEGNDNYLSQVVWKDGLPVTRREAKIEGTEMKVKDTVFLRELVTGTKLTLYELQEEKSHFYIKKPDGEIVELEYKVFRKKPSGNLIPGEDDIVYRYYFRDQLRLYSLEDYDLTEKIDNAQYTASELSKMIAGINGLVNDISSKSVKSVKKLFIGGGVTFNSFKFSGNNLQFLNDLKTLKNTGYSFKINADFFGKKKFRQVFLRTELGYNHFDYEGGYKDMNSAETAEYYLTLNTVTTTVSLARNLLNTTGYNVYLGLGTGLNFSFYPDNRIVSTNPDSDEKIPTKKIWPEIITSRAGVVWKKLNAEFTYRLGGHPLNYTYVHTRFNTLGITVSYQLRS
jgi:hypothetical protein